MLDFEQLRCEIGANIRTQRKNVGYTQQTIAEKAEKTRFWLTAIETGSNSPTIEGLYQLAEIMNCTVYDFLPQKINEKTISFTGSADLINCPETTKQVISMLEDVKNG